MAATAPTPWKVEYAKSSRASCRTCSNLITKDAFRLARMVPSNQFDGFMAVLRLSLFLPANPYCTLSQLRTFIDCMPNFDSGGHYNSSYCKQELTDEKEDELRGFT